MKTFFATAESSQTENIIKQTGTKTIWCLYLSIDIRNRKSVIALQKPTYYLWRTDYTSSEDFEADKEKYRKIGFRAYNDNAQNSEEDEQKKKQAERQKAIADFIGHNYSPIGATSQKCYKTTVELVYELSNIVDVAPMELAKQLTDARYHV